MLRSVWFRPSGGPWAIQLFIALVVAFVPSLVTGEKDVAMASTQAPPLDLDPFEDDDCLEAPGAEVLILLMHEMCELLEQVLWSPEDVEEASEQLATAGHVKAWKLFDAWSEENFATMIGLASPVLGRPYCEPGKVAWMAAECLLLMRRNGQDGAKEALNCAAALDEDLIAQMTPRTERFNTRLHLVLRSPWPALRLLDLLVRLHPERGSSRMGACKSFQKWNSDPDIFDWPSFKPMVLKGADFVTDNTELLKLNPDDGPLSRQYRARWLRVHGSPDLRQAITFSDDVFESY